MGFDLLTANLARAKVQKRTIHGREFLVAPITILAPGVLNGSKGALYYPPEEIARNHADWNGIPILINHSTVNGQSVSGRDPKVWESQGVGHVYNSRITRDGRQVVDGYFDAAALKRINSDVYQRILSGQPVSVSTGLFTQNEPAKGSDHRGRPYTYVARGYKPDHLAILPDQPGACSIEDGCGVLINMKTDNAFCPTGPGGGVDPSCGKDDEGGGGPDETYKAAIDRTQKEMEGLNKKLKKEPDDTKRETLLRRIRAASEENMMARRGYEKNPDGKWSDSQQKGRTNNHAKTHNLGGRQMTPKQKKEIVDGLISNCDCGWGEDDRETLNGFSEEKLQAMDTYRKTSVRNAELVANAEEMVKKGMADEEEVCNEDDEECKAKEGEKKMPMAMNAEDWLKTAPAEIQEAVRESMEITNREREQLIANLTDGLKDKAPVVNALKGKPLTELRALQALARRQPTANWSGAAGATTNTAPKVAPLRSPDSYAEVN
jgi:hypothetical protein